MINRSISKQYELFLLDLQRENGSVLDLALTVLVDHCEAGIVRENAALLLANLCSYLFYTSPDSSTSVSLSITSSNARKTVLKLYNIGGFYASV